MKTLLHYACEAYFLASETQRRINWGVGEQEVARLGVEEGEGVPHADPAHNADQWRKARVTL